MSETPDCMRPTMFDAKTRKRVILTEADIPMLLRRLEFFEAFYSCVPDKMKYYAQADAMVSASR